MQICNIRDETVAGMHQETDDEGKHATRDRISQGDLDGGNTAIDDAVVSMPILRRCTWLDLVTTVLEQKLMVVAQGLPQKYLQSV